MKMNYTDALTLAINTLSTATDEASQKAVEKLTALRATYQTRAEKRVPMSDEKKAEVSAARKEATAAKRAKLVAQVAPILRGVIDHDHDMTAKEIFLAAAPDLPAGFTAPKVQNILLREMAPELVKTEAKGKANTYRLA